MRRTILVLFTVAAGLGAARATHGEISDRIKMLSGQFITGNVTEETYESVKYTSPGVEAKLAQCQVESVSWGDMPDAYRLGEQQRARGNWADAVQNYEKVPQGRGRRWWIEPYTLYNMSLCYLQMGQADKAEELFRKLLKDHPRCKFVPHAHIAIGKINLDRRNWDEAITSFKAVSETVNNLTNRPVFCESQVLEASLKVCEALIGKSDYDAAITQLDRFIGEAQGKHKDFLLGARQLKAYTLICRKQTKEGVAEYHDIIAESVKAMDGTASDGEMRLMLVVAQCANGLGDAYLEAKEYKAALLEYLRVVVSIADAAPSEYSRALVGAIKCFSLTDQKERARALMEELKRKFPNNPQIGSIVIK